jgi:hypothetical protein
MSGSRWFVLALCTYALLGCNDNTLTTFPENNPPPLGDGDGDGDGDADDDDGSNDDDDGGPYDDGQPDDDDVPNADDDDDDDDLPDEWLDDCPPGAVPITDFIADDGGDEIYTLSWGPTEMGATLVAPVAGMYAVYDTYVYESGASQTNESGFLRIRNSVNPDGVPGTPNCGNDFIFQDSDNSGAPPAPLIYLGTFELVQGDNELTMYHYCALFRQGFCEDFHIGGANDSSGCESGNVNSLHLLGEGICLVPR